MRPRLGHERQYAKRAQGRLESGAGRRGGEERLETSEVNPLRGDTRREPGGAAGGESVESGKATEGKTSPTTGEFGHDGEVELKFDQSLRAPDGRGERVKPVNGRSLLGALRKRNRQGRADDAKANKTAGGIKDKSL